MVEAKKTPKQKKKSDDVFLVWWQKYKTVAGVITAIISATVAFNVFLYERVLKPNAEVSALRAQKETLQAQKEFIMSTISLDGHYKELVESLGKQLSEKEAELQILKARLAELLNQSSQDKEKIASLEQQIAIKEDQIIFYKAQISSLEDHLAKANKLIEKLKALKISPDTSKAISLDQSDIAKRAYFRSTPKELSANEVKEMLIKHDFYCKDFYWSNDYCNPSGRGFENDFKRKIIKGDTIVVDHASGLMWQQSGSNEYMEFEEVKRYIDDLNRQAFSGFRDWRLPTLEEAMSLMEPKQINRYLYIDSVFNLHQKWIWTSDLVAGGFGRVWYVSFSYGYCSPYDVSGTGDFVRAVRSGQSSP